MQNVSDVTVAQLANFNPDYRVTIVAEAIRAEAEQKS